jgi:hypothetical protein
MELPLQAFRPDLSIVQDPRVGPAGRRPTETPVRYLMLALAVSAVACESLTGNSASRIAFGLREGAHRLSLSPAQADSITVRIPARTWPGGCPAAYRVEFLPDSAKPAGIIVSCLPKGQRYATNRARQDVVTPKPLTEEYKAGEPMDIVLRRNGAKIEIVSLQGQ